MANSSVQKLRADRDRVIHNLKLQRDNYIRDVMARTQENIDATRAQYKEQIRKALING